MTLKIDSEQDIANSDYSSNGDNSMDFMSMPRASSIGELDR